MSVVIHMSLYINFRFMILCINLFFTQTIFKRQAWNGSVSHLIISALVFLGIWPYFNYKLEQIDIFQSLLNFCCFFSSCPSARYIFFFTSLCFLSLLTSIFFIFFSCSAALSLILNRSVFRLCSCKVFNIFITFAICEIKYFLLLNLEEHIIWPCMIKFMLITKVMKILQNRSSYVFPPYNFGLNFAYAQPEITCRILQSLILYFNTLFS